MATSSASITSLSLTDCSAVVAAVYNCSLPGAYVRGSSAAGSGTESIASNSRGIAGAAAHDWLDSAASVANAASIFAGAASAAAAERATDSAAARCAAYAASSAAAATSAGTGTLLYSAATCADAKTPPMMRHCSSSRSA
eukprot:296134-Chlamydomonas_euryale.AAC.1